MKTIHIFEDACYLIGNKSVAKCFMFESKSDCDDFKRRVNDHLKPICDVLAFGFLNDEFQFMVKVKNRKEIEKYFRERYSNSEDEYSEIPETTYIFAQAMANLQSGYAKYFNFKNKRDGGLMSGRYFRKLMESEEMMNAQIESINCLKLKKVRSEIWTYRRKKNSGSFDFKGRASYRSSYNYYQGVVDAVDFESFSAKDSHDLRGLFKNLPPKRLDFKNRSEKLKKVLAFMFLKYNN